MKKEIKCVLILVCCCSISTAQQVVSSGGHSKKSEISVNWILGGSLSDITAINKNIINKIQLDDLVESQISLKVYPNPTADYINIEIPLVDTGRVNFELYSSSGVKILEKVSAYQSVIQIDISNIPCGIYFLKAFMSSSKDQLFKLGKIIKQ